MKQQQSLSNLPNDVQERQVIEEVRLKEECLGLQRQRDGYNFGKPWEIPQDPSSFEFS